MLRLLFSLVRNVRFFERVLLIFLSFSLSACCLFFVGLIRSLHHLDHMSQIPRFALWWCSSHCLFLCTCLCYMKRKTNKYSKRQSKSWRGPLSRVDFLPPGKSIGNGQRRRENEERVPPSKETKVNTTFTSNLRENYNEIRSSCSCSSAKALHGSVLSIANLSWQESQIIEKMALVLIYNRPGSFPLELGSNSYMYKPGRRMSWVAKVIYFLPATPLFAHCENSPQNQIFTKRQTKSFRNFRRLPACEDTN